MSSAKSGFLITFEGIGGSGKSTLAARTVDWLRSLGVPVTNTREPGGTRLGIQLRSLLLGGEEEPAPWTEAFLFEADRAQNYARTIAPALAAGEVVISDRYLYGTIAYQAFGAGLDLDLVDAMSRAAIDRTYPDLTFVLDVEPRLGLERKRGGHERDRFDERDLAFQEKARQGFLFAAKRDSQRARILDGSTAVEDLEREVRLEISRRLRNRFPHLQS